ncbi:MAG: tetratricopeptide repeat protein [Coriobacteriales bacterium]
MQEADAAYAAGDWHTAATEYLSAAASGGPGSGLALMKAGNALMKLRRYDDAVTVYLRVAEDSTYQQRASLDLNLGAALAASGDHSQAAEAFRRVLADPAYGARYRALQGLAGALEALGRTDEAIQAYGEAARDSGNPDPGRAWNSLGVCLMSQGKVDEAVSAFRAAIASEDYTGKGKAAVNLGFAYAAMGRHTDAVGAFEAAANEYGHTLNEAALAAYDASRQAVESARHEVVEGWRTGELPPVFAQQTGVDVDEIDAFFSRSDEEMREVDKAARREERAHHRSERSVFVVAGTWVAIVAIIVGALGFAWVSGLGYPTQSMTVRGLLEAHTAGKPVEPYWVAVPTADVDKEMSNLPPKVERYELGATERSAKTSSVEVTVILEQGAPLTYKISLAREGVGWKVNGITNEWRSTGG